MCAATAASARPCERPPGYRPDADQLPSRAEKLLERARTAGAEVTTPLTWLHPEIEHPADRLPTDPSCTEQVASVPQVLFANLAVASSLLNTFWLYLCDALHYAELAFDIADGLSRPVLPIGQPQPPGPHTALAEGPNRAPASPCASGPLA